MYTFIEGYVVIMNDADLLTMFYYASLVRDFKCSPPRKVHTHIVHLM